MSKVTEKKLSEISNIVMGQSPSSNYVFEDLEHGLAFLQGCAEFGKKFPNPLKSCSSGPKKANKGSTLISVRAPVGDTNLADRDFIIGRGLASIEANGIDADYLSFAINFSKDNLQRVSQGSTFSAVGSKEISDLLIPVFERNEQIKIAQILTSLDGQIELTNKLIEKKRQLKTGLTKGLLTPRSDWESSSVFDIAVLGRGRVISKEEAVENVGIYPVYSSQSFDNGEFARINSYDFDGEYITWTTDGAYAGSVFYRNGKFSCTNVCGTVKLNEGFSHKFFTYLLQTVAKRYVSYVGNPKLMNGVFASIPIQYPSYAEQIKISNILDCIASEIELEERKLDKLSIQKQGLMKDLLTGRVRVN